ncbi:hypothetical protein [Alicyclobacillus sp. SP_1]|uniref:hypothetical protein n=1 Tax=Alicyclobacillus sp. SP_1 TaxID=2942475 RepID=UPI002157119D|nr:hypothetical protein [Alicyclobacillus sp. SP_1]
MGGIRKDLATLFQAIAQVLSDMTDEDVEELVNGRGKLTFTSTRRRTKTEESSTTVTTSSVRVSDEVVDHLLNLENRDEARQYLSDLGITKMDLTRLASSLDIYISKNDKKEAVVEKIVESTVGSRMRSKAIRDTRLGGHKV